MPAAGSATEEAQEFLGPGTRVVAAFQNVAAHLLRDPKHAIDCDILVCGNDAEARKTVMGLVSKMGLQPIDLGPAEGARVVEHHVDAHPAEHSEQGQGHRDSDQRTAARLGQLRRVGLVRPVGRVRRSVGKAVRDAFREG